MRTTILDYIPCKAQENKHFRENKKNVNIKNLAETGKRFGEFNKIRKGISKKS